MGLSLSEEEMSLFTAVVLISAGRLTNCDIVTPLTGFALPVPFYIDFLIGPITDLIL
jgi:hypothetical protein